MSGDIVIIIVLFIIVLISIRVDAYIYNKERKMAVAAPMKQYMGKKKTKMPPKKMPHKDMPHKNMPEKKKRKTIAG